MKSEFVVCLFLPDMSRQSFTLTTTPLQLASLIPKLMSLGMKQHVSMSGNTSCQAIMSLCVHFFF